MFTLTDEQVNRAIEIAVKYKDNKHSDPTPPPIFEEFAMHVVAMIALWPEFKLDDLAEVLYNLEPPKKDIEKIRERVAIEKIRERVANH